MNRTIFTTEDVKEIIKRVFIDNDEQIEIVENNKMKKISLVKYLNIEFYAFKNDRIKFDKSYKKQTDISSLISNSYGLVEVIDEDATISPDIDFVEKSGVISFTIPESKVELLDYYIHRLRNIYMGKPEKTQNSFGETLNTYLLIGILQYDEEPEETQFGSSIKCSVQFKLTYLTNAATYSDYEISLSTNNDNDYLSMPIMDYSQQIIFADDVVPKDIRPDLSGAINKTATLVVSLSFYDFLQPLAEKINSLFMKYCAIKINNKDTEEQDLNAPVFLKVKYKNDEYVYDCILNGLQKKISNSSYSVTSLTLKGRAITDVLQTE